MRGRLVQAHVPDVRMVREAGRHRTRFAAIRIRILNILQNIYKPGKQYQALRLGESDIPGTRISAILLSCVVIVRVRIGCRSEAKTLT